MGSAVRECPRSRPHPNLTGDTNEALAMGVFAGVGGTAGDQAPRRDLPGYRDVNVNQLIEQLQHIVRKSPSFGESLVHLETCCDCNPLDEVVQGAVDVFLKGYP